MKWPVRRSRPALFVPKTSVVTTTERTLVIRDGNGQAAWVDVKKGVTDGDLVEVVGNLKPGDRVVRRATDEIREGTPIQAASKANRVRLDSTGAGGCRQFEGFVMARSRFANADNDNRPLRRCGSPNSAIGGRQSNRHGDRNELRNSDLRDFPLNS